MRSSGRNFVRFEMWLRNGIAFWDDLHDDFLDLSGLLSGNSVGGGVRFSMPGRQWVCSVGRHRDRA